MDFFDEAAAGYDGTPQPKPLPRPAALVAALERLDAEQKLIAAWKPTEGNLRVSAVAGSGKTTNLVALGARLVVDGDVAPSRLLMLTFANRAAKTLQARIGKLLPYSIASSVRIGTFHGIALGVLRAEDPKRWHMSRCMDGNSRTRSPSVESAHLVWRNVVEWGKVPGTGVPSLKIAKNTEEARRYPSFYSLARSYSYNTPDDLDDVLAKAAPPDFEEAWELFNNAKKAMNAWDFNDVLSAYLHEIVAPVDMAGCPIPARDSADVLLCDEAQDNSRVQTQIIEGLASLGRAVIVGQGAQAIHRWRGAFPEMFLDAPKRMNAKTLSISTNYRSVPEIVELSNRVVAGCSWEVGPPARAFRAPNSGDARLFRRGAVPRDKLERYAAVEALRDGASTDGERAAAEAALRRMEDPPSAIDCLRHGDCAQAVAEAIALATKRGVAPGAFAILTRTNAQLGDFQAALADQEVAYTIVGGDSLFEGKEGMGVLAYCMLADRDAWGSLERVIQGPPKRYLPSGFFAGCRARGGDMVKAIRAEADTLQSNASMRGALALAKDIERLREQKTWDGVLDTVAKLVETAPEKTRKKIDGEAPDDDRPALFGAALRIARRKAGAQALLETAQRMINSNRSSGEDDEQPGGGERVVLSTCHRAKGSEFQHVYLYAEEGTFPSSKSAGQFERADELRLFYVGVTRARDRLTFAFKDKPADFVIDYAGASLKAMEL